MFIHTCIYVCMYVCHTFSSLQFLCSLPKFKTLSHESVTKGVTEINENVYSSLGILIQKKKKKKIQGPELQLLLRWFSRLAAGWKLCERAFFFFF